jgi:hypothetical protein
MVKDALDVARRCLCLELLSQRMILELDTEEPVALRQKARAMWLSRDADLGIAQALRPEERALLERPIGELSEDDLDEVHGLASGALVLLWALGRLSTRPTFATVEAMEATLAEHGLLGDGSIARARAAADDAQVRPEPELEGALSAYARTRGMARETDDPERIFAEVAAHQLEWILGGAQ